MISKSFTKWFMAGDIAFYQRKYFHKKKDKPRVDIWFIVVFPPKVKQSLPVMCLESWNGPKFQEAGYEKYVEFANIWKYLGGNISAVW